MTDNPRTASLDKGKPHRYRHPDGVPPSVCLWIALATSLTLRTLRRGMPFVLTWWSLTYPVGTFVTGTSQLATHTHLPAFRVAAAVAYVGLLSTWLLVAIRTARGSLRGNLLKLPPSAAPIKASKSR